MGVELTQAGSVAAMEHEGVQSLVRLALEKGVDVEVLERLVALQERATDRNARMAFFEAVSTFQEQCPEIPKTKTAAIKTKSGGEFRYTFAPLEAITRTIREPLRASGLSYSWDVDAPGGAVLNVTAVLRHIDGHVERASFPVPIDKGGRMSDAQANGAALTYGKRQSLLSVLGLTTADEDIDGAGHGAETVDYVTREQVADLDALIEEVGVDRGKFLKYAGIESLDQMRAADYEKATRRLEQRRSA
jgi:hypothetical protein